MQLTSVVAVDSLHAWGTAGGPNVLHTADAGAHSSSFSIAGLLSGPYVNPTVTSVTALDDANVFAAGIMSGADLQLDYQGFEVETSTGGNQWACR